MAAELRDELAAAALTGVLSEKRDGAGGTLSTSDTLAIARIAYSLADAMMVVREEET